VQRLRSALPSATREQAESLVGRLTSAAASLDGRLVQDTDRLVRQALENEYPTLTADEVAAVRTAMCLPAADYVRLFDGAVTLLRKLKASGLCTVVVSNVAWRDARAYRRDFQDLGCARYVDEVVTSADVGLRKPHPGVFRAALDAAGCPSERCAMVGNSEVADVRPALQQGMRTVLVQIEEPPRSTTQAHAMARSLPEVAAILDAWHRNVP
jgi:FMN phosphatase YigB (HAD superfamily)